MELGELKYSSSFKYNGEDYLLPKQSGYGASCGSRIVVKLGESKCSLVHMSMDAEVEPTVLEYRETPVGFIELDVMRHLLNCHTDKPVNLKVDDELVSQSDDKHRYHIIPRVHNVKPGNRFYYIKMDGELGAEYMMVHQHTAKAARIKLNKNQHLVMHCNSGNLVTLASKAKVEFID